MHVSPEPAPAAILDQFRRVGFRSLTPFQQRLIPLVFRGRDAAAETAPGSGRIAAAVYTLIIGYRARSTAPFGEAASPVAALLAADSDEVVQATREWARFAKVLGRAPSFSAVGDSDDARREQRRLGAGAAVVVGTPGRIIDHLRRGSLRLETLETLVVSLPEGEARESFVRDVQFVLEKCPARRQTVLLGRPPLAGQEELLALAHHPEIVPAADQADQAVPAAGAPPCEAITLEGADREEALVRLLLSLPSTPALVLHGGRTGGEKSARRLRDLFLRAESLPPGTGAPARRRAIAGLAAGTLDALLVPLPVPDDLDAGDAGLVVWLDLPQPREARRAAPGSGRLVALVGANQARDLAKLEEAIGVTMTKLDLPGDAEVIRGALDRILDRMAEENPAELSRLTGLVRGRVPLLRRTQLAAFLLKAQLPRFAARPALQQPAVAPQPGRERSGGGLRGEGGGRREGRGEGGARREARGERPAGRPTSREPAGGFTQLFVSAGRNRRVFARDLTALFQERLGLSAAEIGAVRVFEKYSFVEVASARAAEAVQRLSGVELKGRQVNVEVAKRKEEKPAR
ncbi:MAG: DEAD/DEAH box helicase [Spirochaetes bacterium]|nr:DEAD/DEAH box helicase [Spirochaetota bacterium]